MRSAAFPHVRQPGVAPPATRFCPRVSRGVERVLASRESPTVVGPDRTLCKRPPACDSACARASPLFRIAQVKSWWAIGHQVDLSPTVVMVLV